MSDVKKLISPISFRNLSILMEFSHNVWFFWKIFAQKDSLLTLVAVPLGEMKFGKLIKSKLEINHFFRQFYYFDELWHKLWHFWMIFRDHFCVQNCSFFDQNTANWLRTEITDRGSRTLFRTLWITLEAQTLRARKHSSIVQ